MVNKKIRDDKRGFLLAEETLKIILAVIGIGFLIFLLGSLYFNNMQDNNLKHARDILKQADENLEDTIRRVEIGNGSLENGSAEEFSFNNPSGWSMFSFIPGEDENIPNPCANKNCVCVCNSALTEEDSLLSKGQSRKCGEEGSCLVVQELNKFEEIKIRSGVNKIKVSENKSGIFIEDIS